MHSRLNRVFSAVALSLLLLLLSRDDMLAQSALGIGWSNPSNTARLRAGCWTLNGNVAKESIAHDLDYCLRLEQSNNNPNAKL